MYPLIKYHIHYYLPVPHRSKGPSDALGLLRGVADLDILTCVNRKEMGTGEGRNTGGEQHGKLV